MRFWTQIVLNDQDNYIHQFNEDMINKISRYDLQAVTSDNPDFRYVVGKDAAMSTIPRFFTCHNRQPTVQESCFP